MGNLLYGNIINSHGLAFLKTLQIRGDQIKKNKLGFYETVSIHDIDLINYFFKIKKSTNQNLKIFRRLEIVLTHLIPPYH